MTARQATCVAIRGRGVLIEGAPGTGKSGLALALIERGAELIGDDGVLVTARDGRLFASPHPRTRGLIEVRNLGLLPFPARDAAPLCLLVTLDPQAPRFIEAADTAQAEGLALPAVRIWPADAPPALKVELALAHYGLPAA